MPSLSPRRSPFWNHQDFGTLAMRLLEVESRNDFFLFFRQIRIFFILQKVPNNSKFSHFPSKAGSDTVRSFDIVKVGL